MCLFHTFPTRDPALLLCLSLYMLTALESVMFFLVAFPLLPRITELPWPALCPDLRHVPQPPLNHRPQDSAPDLHRRVAVSCPHTLNLSFPQPHRPGITTPKTMHECLNMPPVAVVMVSDGSC